MKRYIIPLLTLLLSGCIKDQGPVLDPKQPARTLIVYLAADNNLISTVSPVVEAIREGWTYTSGNCLIYLDTPNNPPTLLRVRGGCKATPIPYVEQVATYPAENSASGSVLERVIKDVVRDYPAQSYGLILTSHASGWLPQGTLVDPNRSFVDPNRSFGQDTQAGSYPQGHEMEIAELAAAIPNHQFEFIIVEACLMASVEVAYCLKDKTNYILASAAELLAPGFLKIYPTQTKTLLNTAITTQEALTQFATEHFNLTNEQFGAYKSTTISIINTSKLDSLALLCSQIYKNPAPHNTDIQYFDRPGMYSLLKPRFFDLQQHLQSLASPKQNDQLQHLLTQIIPYKAATPYFMQGYQGFAINSHCGLTVYIEQPEYPKINGAYRNTAWWAGTR